MRWELCGRNVIWTLTSCGPFQLSPFDSASLELFCFLSFHGFSFVAFIFCFLLGAPLSSPIDSHVKCHLRVWWTSWRDHFCSSLLWPQCSVLKHTIGTEDSLKSLVSESSVYLDAAFAVLPETKGLILKLRSWIRSCDQSVITTNQEVGGSIPSSPVPPFSIIYLLITRLCTLGFQTGSMWSVEIPVTGVSDFYAWSKCISVIFCYFSHDQI